MASLVQQRCFYHEHRPASARCPRCGRFFCRECVTEHGGRVICAACLRKPAAETASRSPWPARVGLGVATFGGLLLAWLAFYALGQYLLTLPSTFHGGGSP